jgi:hypothetical protein
MEKIKQKRLGKVFVDSGAHSLYTKYVIKKGHSNGYAFYESDTFWNYVDEYAEWLKPRLDKIQVYVNVDVIFNPELTWKVQKYLESEHKLLPLPVVHFNSDMKWLKKYMDDYEYIGIGGVGQEVNVREYVAFGDRVFSFISDDKGMPLYKIHGFALTSPSLLHRYPWYCMTEEDHEVLTKTGWKYQSKLYIGEEVLAFDKGKTKWDPILEIPIFPVKNVEITNMENSKMEAHISNNHRWPVTNHNTKKGWKFKETDYLVSSDCIPRIGKD